MTSRIHPTLPIFRLDDGDRVVLYTPGQPVTTTQSTACEVEGLLAGRGGGRARARALASQLEQRGTDARNAWHGFADGRFEPVCLTLYLSNRCTLACTYCYAMPADEARARDRSRARPGESAAPQYPILAEDVIAAAGRLVASNCAAAGKPLTLVVHGGGEPTMHWDLLARVRQACAEIAAGLGIGFWSYIATHGVLPDDRAHWLARHFDLIGLSCDGPPDIQDANRPSAAHASTAARVERTAQVLHAAGADYAVRCTVTPAAASRQVEIVTYLCDRLFARKIRLEPAYDGRRAAGRHFTPDDAEMFVSHFLEAYEAAKRRGCDLELSGVRIGEIHGPFCNPSRDVLQLTPDGTASACFLSVGNNRDEDAPLVMGTLDPVSGQFLIDRGRVAAQRRHAALVPSRCESCHNIYHCARDCPDVCLLTGGDTSGDGGFRCRVQKLVGRYLILESR